MKVKNILSVIAILFIIILFYSLFTFYTYLCKEGVTKAKNGVLDLTQKDFADYGVIPLDGQWEFFWEKLYNPGDLLDTISNPDFKTVPNQWDKYRILGSNIPVNGYATYRLTVKTKHITKYIGLSIPYICSAYKLWVNNELVSSVGVVGTSAQEMIPQNRPKIILFATESNLLDIVIQVSNYYDDSGGILQSIKLGRYDDVSKETTLILAFNLILFGSCVIMGFYFISLYIIRKKEKAALFFGIVCLIVAIRILDTGQSFIATILPCISWIWQDRIDDLTFILGSVFYIYYLFFLFPEEALPKFFKYLSITGIFLAIIILITQSRIYNYLVHFYQINILIGIIYLVFILFKSTNKQKDGWEILVSGIFITFLAGINDILQSTGIIQDPLIIPAGFFISLFLQSYFLSYRFAKAFSDLERFDDQLKRINRVFSRFVPKKFINILEKQDINQVELGDHRERLMTVMFCDIRDFTAISEKMTPEENFKFINSYLGVMEPIIINNNGFIDKFIGDTIMALFEHSDDAVRAALVMKKQLLEYNKDIKNPIQVGFGINTGTMILGIVGGLTRIDSTVISDAVNLASRIEGLTKNYEADILISEFTYKDLPDRKSFKISEVEKVRIKGKTEPIMIYQVERISGLT